MAILSFRIFPLFLLLLVFGLVLSMGTRAGVLNDATLAIDTDKGSHLFRIELVNTPSLRSRGLMFRRHMPDNTGMLFDFRQEQPVTMWMKNTFISLDILFIDNSGRIINIARRTKPHSLKHIPSLRPARSVLEIRGGLAEDLGIKVGDRVRHRIFPFANQSE